MKNNMKPSFPAFQKRQAGLTLIELMVAMVISLLIVLAAVAALVVSRQGFSSVDTASQLRDNSRFAVDLIQRLGVQAGYKDVRDAATALLADTAGIESNPPPNIYGINNQKRSQTNAWDESSNWSSSEVGRGSDILIIRNQASRLSPTATTSDETMIDCMGNAPTAVPIDRYDRMISILHVSAGDDGEPSLMCTYVSSAGSLKAEPLIRGVENFQVLYGVDGIGPNNATLPASSASSPENGPERYLRADQITNTSNAAVSYANWQRVRSLRIGMVVRGPSGSAIDKSSQTLYPMGTGKGSSSGSIGSGLADATNDPGTVVTFNDGRLRQTVTFTVHLRNYQQDN
ncbi:PilW family protein [Paracidovorax valerianellae]|uniref:Type IV pilus assembly protein PilW n=1 Tax=Paracidovorax valerianellae TaxID=187868 RepID=A0A1G6X7P4_9BURK|nr:PilW family protein [Paracidovorax valerianellae]MDA8447732.1 PilW family protein [Paracidovorax valerianellae]SDD73316.1 type IV pilus assembly protein PilW [Paracidovorax valerianellae]